MAVTQQPVPEQSLRARLGKYVPIIDWLPKYQPSWLRFDILAGLTLGAFTIPEAIAYASLAGMPPAAGLYTSILAMFAYVIFGTSKHAAVGATSALAIMVASGVAVLELVDPTQYAVAMALLTIMVGIVGLVAFAIRLGFIVNFMSEPVLTGFSAGAALYIATTQLPKLFGVPGGGDNFFERIAMIVSQLGETNMLALGIGIAGIVALYFGEKFFRKLPVALIVVLASGAIVALAGWSDDLHTIGVLPQGLPHLSIPPISYETVRGLLPTAFAAFLLAFVEGMSVVRTMAEKHKEKVDPNQELLALGVANISSGLGGGMAVGPSLSRSAVSDASGGKTQLTGLFAAIVICVVVILLPSLFATVPESILAAVVIIAVRGLFNARALRRLFRVSRRQFWIAMGAMFGVLAFGMLEGILIGVIMSVLNVLWRISYPRMVVLGRVPGTEYYMDVETVEQARPVSGVLIYRVDGNLFFANASNVREHIVGLVDGGQTKLVIMDLSASPHIDISAVEMLVQLQEDLSALGIQLQLADIHLEAHKLLLTAEPEVTRTLVGKGQRVSEIVTEWESTSGATDQVSTKEH